MSPVNNINIPNVTIPNVVVSNQQWIYGIPSIPSNHPPITTQIGFPIVDMPGCVKMHQDNKEHVSRLPFDKDLVNQDPKGTTTLCPHGEYPSYEAMEYTPEQLIIQRETPPPPVSPPPEVDAPEVPPTGDLIEKEISCPGPNQLRVGDVTQSGDERVVGHRLIDNGKTCETLYEPTSIVEKFLPSANQATTTVSIAVLATAGAAATPLLLRVIKPAVKKVITFVKKKLGKNVSKPSMSEVRTNKYREKKGLPPIKKKN
tara:strand:- start:1041 stop:1814 length:774 start_codon:yes stop_codon:yes gene_type:complete